jgi:type VI secretion system secreted protein Hcp
MPDSISSTTSRATRKASCDGVGHRGCTTTVSDTSNRKLTNVTSNVSGGAGDMFLMVKGAKHGLIKGESQDDQHKGEIDVVSWSWGMQAKASIATGLATGKATINDLRIVKRVDSASTALMLALRTNEPIQKAVLTLRKAGKGQLEYLKVTIEQGRVISLTIDTVETTGSPDVLERVSFSFNKIEVEYVPQGKDGLPQGSLTFADQWSDQS